MIFTWKQLAIVMVALVGFSVFASKLEKSDNRMSEQQVPRVVTVELKSTRTPIHAAVHHQTETSSSTVKAVVIDLVTNPVMIAVNKYRDSRGLPEVSENDLLCDMTLQRLDQVKKDFSHSQFYSAIRPEGYWIENLARYASESNVLDAWKASPTHNANLLAKVKYMCIRWSSDGHFVLEGWRP